MKSQGGMKLLLPAALIGGAAVAMLVRKRSPFSFAKKRIVIIGGSRGLGLIMARQLVAAGAHVALLARDVAELERAYHDLLHRGAQRLMTHQCDVRDQRSVQTAIDKVADEFGGIDVLVNTAGIIGVGPVQHMQVADFEDAMATHFWGPLYASLAVLPYMRRQGGGRILTIASLGGKITLPHLGPYSVSKAAGVSLAELLRMELAEENIVVTCACPGPMRTGAHVNAKFKGRQSEEFSGFALIASLPLMSIDAVSAARTILHGLRDGKATVYVPSLFRFGPVLNILLPTLMANTLAKLNHLMAQPTDESGDVAKEGWDSLTSVAPSVLTYLGDKATVENNGLRGHAPLIDTNGNAAKESVSIRYEPMV